MARLDSKKRNNSAVKKQARTRQNRVKKESTQTRKSRASKSRDGYQRARHARYYENNLVYHVVLRTRNGFCWLSPDKEGVLKRVVAGVLGRSKKSCPSVRLHGASIVSNHGHLCISGNHAELGPFVGFVKREISRRWGPHIDVRGLMEDGYFATAIITKSAQRNCLKYLLAQSVKEGLVERPQLWPGFHCVEPLLTGEPITGEWLNATDYGKALRNQARRKEPGNVNREDFLEKYPVTFEKLPAFKNLSDDEYRSFVATLVDEVVAEAKEKRQGKPPLGLQAIFATDRMTRSEVPLPPWFEDRRRMVVWDDPKDPEVEAYLQRYWTFQIEFRKAADSWREGHLKVRFPPGSYRPGLSRPIPHLLTSAA